MITMIQISMMAMEPLTKICYNKGAQDAPFILSEQELLEIIWELEKQAAPDYGVGK